MIKPRFCHIRHHRHITLLADSLGNIGASRGYILFHTQSIVLHDAAAEYVEGGVVKRLGTVIKVLKGTGVVALAVHTFQILETEEV